MGYLACILIFGWPLLLEITIASGGGQDHPPSGPRPSPGHQLGNILNVMDYGAKGDGATDDTKAFLSAWRAACSQRGDATVRVPSGKSFLVSEIQFEGQCKTKTLKFEILGTILAPPKKHWRDTKTDAWIKFEGVNGLRVTGNGQGTINGQGDSWWSSNGRPEPPNAIRFLHCNNLEFSGLKQINPQKSHVGITGCNQAKVSGIHMIAPAKSPNTDGIDISSSTHIYIRNCTMQTGDDCIAVNGGSSNVYISEVNCGPGHGISVGSLGAQGKHEEVETVSVDRCNFIGSTNGARIKTWQGGSGFARNINFTNLIFTASGNGVIIDQFYCPHKTCGTKTSAVKISDVYFRGLRGTSTCKTPTISIRCSSTVPCKNIQLEDVDIRSSDGKATPTAECINTVATVTHRVSPNVNCKKINSEWD